MRVIIFGTGKLYEKNKQKLSQMDIVAFLDNDIEKRGKCIDGKVIDLPQNIFNYEYEYVLLISIHYKEMRRQLEQLGVSAELIIDREDKGYWANLRKIEKYDLIENRASESKVLLVTHDFSLTGAPIMLYYASKILKDNGYDVTVYSKADGKLKYDYLKIGISVEIFEDYNFTENEIYQYFSKYQMILVNTVTLFELVDKMRWVNSPVIWWLHEEDNVYEEYQIKILPEYSRLYIYGVSNRAVNAYKKYSGKSRIEEFTYGIPFEVSRQGKKDNHFENKVVFAIIGCVSERKGHDVLVASVEKNWGRWNPVAEFWIIGIITDKQREELEVTGKFKIFGCVDHRTLVHMYSQIDVVVCPSRNDPMPVILAEGMMNKKVCIASDMTGTAEKIIPYENGLICRAGDVDSLSDQIDWILYNRDKLEGIGERAYDIYKKNFSYEKFQNELLGIIDFVNKKRTLE